MRGSRKTARAPRTAAWRTASQATPALPAGTAALALSYVRGGTPTSVQINVTSAAASSNLYYVMWNVDAEGMPTTVHASWGPFDASVATYVTLSGQSTAITARLYWCGQFCPSDNSGSVPAGGTVAGLSLPADRTGVGYSGYCLYMTGLSTTPASLASATMRANPPDSTNYAIPMLWGK